ncbi:MAG: carboxypeptidase regulatory-like domain-containing protein [Calditrichaeota bacterium]|nr:MAG: carboxypeptidase regulatory-like domain-containing protein [Calditrichota bacterium]
MLFLTLLMFSSCLSDAERKNPLDPQSQSFKNVGRVFGQTLTFYVPFSPLPGVDVRLEPGTIATRTDAAGQFQFENVPEGVYTVVAEKPGFAMDRDSVTVRLGQASEVRLNLDGLPVARVFSVTSCHISRVFPENDQFFLEVVAQLDDPDGANDVVKVELEIPELAYKDTLEVTPTPGTFRRIIDAAALPGGSLQGVLGRKLVLNATDRAGFSARSEPQFLARVIEATPSAKSPNGFNVVASPTPQLVWAPITLNFDYTFKLDVFRVDFGLNTLVWSRSGISADSTSFTVSDSLSSGIYFWTVSVVDDFGNWSSSKQASFQVQ